jgi:hypothetical protein
MEYRGQQYSVILTIGGKWKWLGPTTSFQIRRFLEQKQSG